MLQTFKTPTPQNISKWSYERKRIKANNEFLKVQLESKTTEIKNLKKQIDELNIKLILEGFEIPSEVSKSTEVYFEFELIKRNKDSLIYSVSNNDFDFDNEVEIPLCEIREYFEDSEITQSKLNHFIKEYLIENYNQ